MSPEVMQQMLKSYCLALQKHLPAEMHFAIVLGDPVNGAMAAGNQPPEEMKFLLRSACSRGEVME